MEREEKNIFYIGAALEGREKKRILLAKGLPIKKSGRGFSYLSYEGRTVTSRLQVYFALMPRFEKGFSENGDLRRQRRSGSWKRRWQKRGRHMDAGSRL